MRKDIREKSKRGRRIRKTYKWELKSSPMGGDFFFISEKDIEKNHDISIQKISEEYQRKDEGRDEGKNGN